MRKLMFLMLVLSCVVISAQSNGGGQSAWRGVSDNVGDGSVLSLGNREGEDILALRESPVGLPQPAVKGKAVPAQAPDLARVPMPSIVVYEQNAPDDMTICVDLSDGASGKRFCSSLADLRRNIAATQKSQK